jgi:hypothetical protein
MSEHFVTALASLSEKDFQPFKYLQIANELLSNPYEEVMGRELVIRALDKKIRFSNYENILKAMVRKAGLFPYLFSEFETRTIEEDYAIGIYQAEDTPGFIYHSMQLKIVNLLREGRNVVLSAPTSMGKSIIVDSLIACGRYKRIVIVVPTIALIDETRRRIAKKFSKQYDVISHNSQRVRGERRTVFVLTQERVNEREDLKFLDLFVIDEFYKLAFKRNEADERTIALNICLSKLLLASTQFYMIGPSVDDVRGLNNFGKDYVFVPAVFNTVAVNVKEHNLGANDRGAKISAVVEILKHSSGDQQSQTIIYCRSPKAAAEIVEDLIDNNFGVEATTAYTEWIDDHYSPSWSYARAIRSGIGIHHGALPRALQQYTVDLFNEKKVRILICTSTIIEGVNTNAETVIVFDNRSGTGSIDRFTHNNIKGRAGRMNVHFVGTVHCLERIPEDTLSGRVVDVPLGLQSSESPLNLLAGIEEEHVQEAAAGTLREYFASSFVPIWILKKHATYNADILRRLLVYIESLSTAQLREACAKRPNSAQIEMMCESLRIAEYKALQNLNLHYIESDLKLKFSRYLFAKDHQSYLDSIVAWIDDHNDTIVNRSTAFDRDLKIIRNIFGFAVPRSLSLLEDLVNYIFIARECKDVANFGYVKGQFENSHLPGAFSAIEEMGVPVQVLAKLVSERLGATELNTLVRFLRINFCRFENLSPLDRQFISRALL